MTSSRVFGSIRDTITRNAVARRGMATASPRIGDKQVAMSNLEKGKYINYQRIDDTLQVVKSR